MTTARKVPPTLQDIAEKVGVSRTTVSNVLNGTGRVSPETAARIRRAVEESRFIVNASARTLRGKPSQIVSVLVPVLDHTTGFHDNPFYWSFVAGLKQAMGAAGFQILLEGIDGAEEFIPSIQARNLDGVVVIGAYESFPITQRLAQVDTPPVVFVDSYLPSLDVNVVTSDDRFGSYLATRYLLGLGHRRILFLSGARHKHGVDSERWEGYVQALAEDETRPLGPVCMEASAMSFEGGRAAAHRIAYEQLDVTGIVATGDILALGVLRGFFECGIAVPQERSVVGFDDIQMSQYSIPSLTTIRQDIRGKGRYVGAMLLDLMANPDIKPRTKVALEPRLVVRESTGPYRLMEGTGKEVMELRNASGSS